MARRSFSRNVLPWSGAAVLFAGLLLVVVAISGGRAEKGPVPSALLLNTADWKVVTPDLADATAETFDHRDSTGSTVNARRWTIARDGDDIVVRQEVQRGRNKVTAHRSFGEKDPNAVLSAHFGALKKIGTDNAAHADEATAYCVPRPAGCFIVEYWLRYGSYLVQLSMTGDGLEAGSGEALLASLDPVIAAKVS